MHAFICSIACCLDVMNRGGLEVGEKLIRLAKPFLLWSWRCQFTSTCPSSRPLFNHVSLDTPVNWARSFRLEHPASRLSIRCFETDFDLLSTMLVHSVPRTARTSPTSSQLCSRKLSRSIRSFQTSAHRLAPTFSATHQAPMTSQSHTRSAHAISNPTLAGIEKRWEGMPPQEQAELWMQLRDRMKVDWNEMTLQEKKAGMYYPYVMLQQAQQKQRWTATSIRLRSVANDLRLDEELADLFQLGG